MSLQERQYHDHTRPRSTLRWSRIAAEFGLLALLAWRAGTPAAVPANSLSYTAPAS